MFYITMISGFIQQTRNILDLLPLEEISKAASILHSVYERNGRIYVFGNGGSWALAGHWVGDFNKTIFSGHLDSRLKRFQAIRIPSSDAELTAWANDVGYDMVFAGPLANYIQDSDVVVAISSSGESPNVIKAVELAKSRSIPIIGLSGFKDTNRLNWLADAKIHIPVAVGEYELVESIHGVILHALTRYFRDYFNEP